MASGTHFSTDANNSLRRMGSVSLPRTMSRQLSIYSLTLDQFQNTLGEPGKDFGSMNMDELLKNIWTAEESQAMAAALFTDNNTTTANNTGNESNSGNESNPGSDPVLNNNSLVREPSLMIQRQNSLTLLPLPQSISSKTVDEVWKQISDTPDYPNPLNPMKTRADGTTYGEITLEDFLIKAGVMDPDAPAPVPPAVYYPNGGSTPAAYGNSGGMPPILGGMTGLIPSKKEPMEVNDAMLGIGLGPSTSANGFAAGYGNGNGNSSASVAAQAARNQAEWIESQYKNSTALAQQQQQQQMMQLAMMNGGAGQMNLGGMMKESSPGSPLSDAQGGYMNGNGNYNLDGPLRGRKRILDAPLEKIVERRQRRMIKNRESAARSRARKQAYTVELEAEVTQLKEENMRLKKLQEEEKHKRKKQVVEVISPIARHLPKMLRRTVTGPW